MSTPNPPSTPQPIVQEKVRELLEGARSAYIQGGYAAAEGLNKRALVAARELDCRAGEVRALRYFGLCAYRLGEAERSVLRLRDALAAAEALGWMSEQLLVRNHLGASLRKAGDLQQAHDVLAQGLEIALGAEFLMERIRLLGNMGALCDDLGDLDAAADFYGRYQELLGLTGDVSRQANAAGLNSRVQRLRGRHDDALKSARLEKQLGSQVQNTVRASRGALHEAQVLSASGRHAEAREALDAAQRLLADRGDGRHVVRLAGARARACLDAGEIFEADAHARAGWEALLQAGLDRELEMTARLSEISADVSSAAGLHGEALWYVGKALDAHLERFESISSESLRDLTRGRRGQLCAMAERLLAEEGSVGRASDETERVRSLMDRLSAYDETPPVPHGALLDVKRWRSELEEVSTVRWRAMLGAGIDQLGAGTRGDLVLSDLLGHGPVGDLPRSLFLLLTALERELYQRVFKPLGRLLPDRLLSQSSYRVLRGSDRPPAMGGMLHFLAHTPESPIQESVAVDAWRRLRALAQQLDLASNSLDGKATLTPMALRNAIAHGRETRLSRLQADRIRRVLSLGVDAPLRVVGEVCLVED